MTDNDMTGNEAAAWKIGELARASGLTVRTLHYYDEIGLLAPSARNGVDHRVYSDVDVQRLYRIRLLRDLGVPLGAISGALDQGAYQLADVLGRHSETLDQRIGAEQALRTRIGRLLTAVEETHSSLVTADDLLGVLEEMAAVDLGVQRRISILVYNDIERAHAWLVDTFGFAPGTLARAPDGSVVHGELLVGDGVVWLHRESPEFGLASPRSLGGATGTVAVIVDDVDAHHVSARDHGAEVHYPPVDQPYGYREYSALDCEGHLWSFMKPLE